jgi:NADPH:quinone reductase-like Zn-dependent oxidoreductase
MKAIRAHGFGGPEVLHLDEIPRPDPGPGDVLVRVLASSVNPIDWKLRQGLYKELSLPFIPGGDFVGTIDALGPEVTTFRKGQEVYGCAPGSIGAQAEYVVVPAATMALKPRTLDSVGAASVPLASMTAWQALFDHGKLAAGQHLLILGASGGVGSFAVQFAKTVNARVSGTASTANVERVRALGADHVIDYKKERIEDAVKDVDLCVDLVGGELQRRAFSVIKKGGRLVSTVQSPEEREQSRGIQAMVFRQQPNGEQLRRIGELIDAGKVKIDVARVLPLDRASEAEELNRRHEVTGKIVLRVAS